MAPLIRIRSERDQMSAIERRIADYLLENAHFLRDYSSQQLADALGISQSSVVKFSQKLGFKGYPDLKLSVAQALARDGNGDEAGETPQPSAEPHTARAEQLWRGKTAAEEETRLLNPNDTLEAIASKLHHAGRIFLCGTGEDGLRAIAFAARLAKCGLPALAQPDPVLMATSLTLGAAGDVLLLFCEHGRQPELAHLIHPFRVAQGIVVSVTRHSANPLRALADHALLVSAHAERAEVEPLLYQAALQQLLDVLLLGLCDTWPERAAHFARAVEAQRGGGDN